jgi:galactokinase
VSSNAAFYVGRAPGRLDLMGGNVDYTGGLVFQATIREATWAVVQLREDDRLCFFNPQMKSLGWEDCPTFRLDDLTDEQRVRASVNREPGVRWTAYVLGLFYWLRVQYPELVRQGADVYITTEVPLNKGVSSSASVEVAVMKTAARAYGIELAGVKLAEACQWVENVIAESACGIMDQMAVVLGDEGAILPLLCQPCVPYDLVRLPKDLECWGIDSGVSHAVTGIEYEAARAASFIGYKLICDCEGLAVTPDTSGQVPRSKDPRWQGYLSNLTPSLFRSRHEYRLPETITGAEYLTLAQVHVDPFTVIRADVRYRVRACTRYSVEENSRVRMFTELARGGTGFEQMGELMYQSHYSYTECGLGNQATDLLVDYVREAGLESGLLGAKISGGGAGGTVAVLGYKGARSELQRVADRYGAVRGFDPYVFEGSSMGADRFGILTVKA